MSKRKAEFYLVDIFIASFKIDGYVSKFSNSDDFLHEDLYWDATIRELQIIGEATNQLIKLEVLDNSYRDIVDFRNSIVHGYFGVDASMVWGIVKDDLKDYLESLNQVIKEKNINLAEAIKFAIKEYEEQSKKHIINFLKDMEP